jgi:hypothetical protein
MIGGPWPDGGFGSVIGFGGGIGCTHVVYLAWGPLLCVWRVHDPQVADWEELHKNTWPRDYVCALLNVCEAAPRALEDLWYVA